MEPALTNASSAGPGDAPPSSGRCWLLVLAAGLLAGLAGFGIGEVAPKMFPISTEFPPEIRGTRIAIEFERAVWASPATGVRRFRTAGWG